MIQLKTFEAFWELYKRFIFRNRMLLESKKTNEKIYFSHPSNESLILIKKRIIEEQTETPQVEELDEDDEFFDEYDEIETEDEKSKNAQTLEEQSIYNKLLKFSTDNKNWVPLTKTNLSQIIEKNEKAYVCDLFESYCYELNVNGVLLLMLSLNEIEEEFEYYSIPDITSKYYRGGESTKLQGVKVSVDADGNEKLEDVEYGYVDYYSEKFIANFEKVSIGCNNQGIQTVAEEVKAQEQRLKKIAEQEKIRTVDSEHPWTDSTTEIYQTYYIYSRAGKFAWLNDNKENWDCQISVIRPQDKYFLDELKDLKSRFYGTSNLENMISLVFDVAKCVMHCPRRDIYTLADRYSENLFFEFIGKYINPLIDNNEFFFLNYTDTLFSDLQEYLVDYEQYKDNVDNFSPGYVGIGIGKKGIADSIITSAVASAATSFVNERIQHASISNKYVQDALAEFFTTQESKNFILKLMEFDSRICSYALYDFEHFAQCYFFKQFGATVDDIQIDLPIVRNYMKATKYYAVYLAKVMQLKYIPRYTDENGKLLSTYSLKELLENAIKIFPYEEEYYTSYLKVCGENRGFDNLTTLMRVAGVDDVNIVDIEEQEAIQRQVKEAAEKAQREKEAEERAFKEKQRRDAEERRQKYFDEIFEIYGEPSKKREVIFKSLINNTVYNTYFKKPYSSTLQLCEDVDKYIATNRLSDEKFYTRSSYKFLTSLQKAKSAYVTGFLNDDDVLAVFDSTLFGNCKNGFIISKNVVYSKDGMLSDAGQITLDEVTHILTSYNEGVALQKSKDGILIKTLCLPGTMGKIGELAISIIVNQMYITDKDTVTD